MLSAASRYWRLLAGSPRGATALLLVLMALVSLTEGVGVVMLVPLLDGMSGAGAQSSLGKAMTGALHAVGLDGSVGALLAVFLAVVLARTVLQHFKQVRSARYQHEIVDALRLRSFAALLNAEWRWLSASRASDHANIILTRVSQIGTGLHYFLALIVSVLNLGVYLAAAVLLSWQVALVAMACSGLLLLAFSGRRSQAVELGRGLGAAQRTMQATVQEGMAGVRLTKLLRNEARHLGVLARAVEGLRHQQMRFVSRTSEERALLQLGGAALLAVLLYVGLTFWKVPLSQLLTITLVFGRLVPMFGGLQQQLHQALHAAPAIEQLDALLADCAQAAEPGDPADLSPWPVTDGIVLDGVGVGYLNRARPALDDISLRFPARTTTAVIGPSGAGKSTLADLVMGLLEPDRGTIAIDGVPMAGRARRRWRGSVAYVQQDAFLFHDTIRNNLAWACPEATEADLERVLALASADFVDALPEGLETVVGDGGLRLSGGERQRLALARALLGSPSLLILDEATSALDPANEASVWEAIARLHGDLTIIVIGHRLGMLDQADQVVVLEEGRVTQVRAGPGETLLAS